MLTIRPERPEDIPGIRLINLQAFGQPTEADIVDQLRQTCRESLSLVAEDNRQLVGHILFTPAVIECNGRQVIGMGLAPMAVLPKRQRQEIGSALVRCGLYTLREQGCPFVIVLGHPHFYPRFGFEIASRRGLVCQWEGIPDEAFMVLIMNEEVMKGITGIVRYRDEFNEAM